ncbi:hypothetical protein HDR66_03130 [bacterium]|nr:hypothetical protein [bacterium]
MISPHRYAQQRKQDLASTVTCDVADMTLAHLHVEPEIVVRIIGDVPRCIPPKYHKKLMELFVTSYMNAMYKKTTHRYAMSEKHRMLAHALRYVGNVRESAGR